MMKHTVWALGPLLVTAAGACGHTRPAPSIASAEEPTLALFNDQEVLATYEDMAVRLSMPATVRAGLAERLRGVLAHPDFEPQRGGIQGVVVYSGVEGGLILKVASGRGLVSFKGREARPISLKSASLGAQIGGSREWGVGLVLGLSKAGYFGGEYVGSTTGATIVTASGNVDRLRLSDPSSDEAKHRIYAIGRAAGVSADAGGTRIVIRYAEPSAP